MRDLHADEADIVGESMAFREFLDLVENILHELSPRQARALAD